MKYSSNALQKKARAQEAENKNKQARHLNLQKNKQAKKLFNALVPRSQHQLPDNIHFRDNVRALIQHQPEVSAVFISFIHFYRKKYQLPYDHQKIKSIQDFCRDSLNEFAQHLEKNPNDSWKTPLTEICTQQAKKHFKHDHRLLRALADLLFIPLGLATAGLLFHIKRQYTGSCLFSTANTNRADTVDRLITKALRV